MFINHWLSFVRGDETVKGHLWDRHYGIAIPSDITHLDCGERACGLNAVAFHPHDQETLVTAGDDKLLKVWRSKHRQAEISRSSNTKSIYDRTRIDEQSHDFYEGTDEAQQSHDICEGDTNNDAKKNYPRRQHKLCSCIKKQDSQ
jgi:WD40 repeat protein